jgi:methylglutaconyl-CoA hydratase
MTDTVLYSLADGVATIRLNRPAAHNALDLATGQALIAACRRAGKDEAVRVVVIAADGPTFSAGGDFNWVLSWPKSALSEVNEAAQMLADAIQTSCDLPKPTIARVQGSVAGGGVCIMLACDYAVAAEGARIGLTSVRNGLLAGIAIPVLIQAVGPRLARQMLMHGGMYQAAEALKLGLVDRVVPKDGLDAEIAKLAGELHLGAPSVQALIKRLVAEMDAAPNDNAMAHKIAQHVAAQCLTDDATEGMSAFLQKRKPGWIASGAEKDESRG